MARPTAQVVRVSGPTATILHGGATREARIAPRLPGRPLVVGDEVELRDGTDEAVIEHIRPRRSVVERASGPDGPRRPIVANADLLVVVDALMSPDPRPTLVDHYLVAAALGGLDAAVVYTKADIARDPGDDLVALYRGAGYPTLRGSGLDPAFVEDVRGLIDGRVAALVGQSGVGKSVLTRGLTGIDRAVGAVSERIGGRHTTTDPRLIPMPTGGAVVDTAGVRTLFLPSHDVEDLAAAFPEIRAVSGECRFRDCRHVGEAGCALPGRIASSRYATYRSLVNGASTVR